MEEQTADILIIGGGVAGIAAAVGASENNSVLLIDANGYLGGNATVSEVGTICGLYHFSYGDKSTYISDGFMKEFAERIQSHSNSKPIKNKFGLHFLPYDTEVFKKVALGILKENNISYVLNSRVKEVNQEGKAIKSIVVNCGKDLKKINCSAIVDCSGVSIISELANQPLLNSGLYQSAAIVFEISNIDISSEFGVNILLAKHVNMFNSNHKKKKSFHSTHVIPGSFKNNSAKFKMGIPVQVTDDKENHDLLKRIGRELVQEFFEILKKEIIAFKDSTLDHIADNIGIRVQKRPIGKYVLEEADIIECRKFPNAIAKSAWPIEEWNEDLKVSISQSKEDDWYEIPKEALLSKKINNLFFGGKNISATDRAIGSARVMGVCLQTGFSAGEIALEFTKNSFK